jgi:hypothetical protein
MRLHQNDAVCARTLLRSVRNRVLALCSEWTMRIRRSSVPLALLIAASAACAHGGTQRPGAGHPQSAPQRESSSHAASVIDSGTAARTDSIARMDEIRRDSAHMAFLEMNARMHANFRARYNEQTCPPMAVYRASASRRYNRPAGARPDTLRGWIRVCGHGDARRAALTVHFDSTDVALVGHQNVLQQMENLDVVIFGRRSTARAGGWPRLDVQREIVRANGAGFEAVDGILHRERAGDYIELANRRRVRIPLLPDALSGANGMRVYIAGPLDAPLQAEVIRGQR